jgi:DNA ligase (NAD+)
MGELSANKLIDSIAKSKKRPLDKFLFSMGIRHVGERTAQILAKYCGSLAKFQELKLEELLAINEIGQETALAIQAFLVDPAEKALISDLLGQGVAPDNFIQTRHEVGSLSGWTFVITGTLPTLSRTQAKDLLEKAGGTVVNSVSRNTNYVVVGEDAGSKLAKATELGITTLSEHDLMSLLNVTPP